MHAFKTGIRFNNYFLIITIKNKPAGKAAMPANNQPVPRPFEMHDQIIEYASVTKINGIP